MTVLTTTDPRTGRTQHTSVGVSPVRPSGARGGG